jgi:hypothetical protein
MKENLLRAVKNQSANVKKNCEQSKKSLKD